MLFKAMMASCVTSKSRDSWMTFFMNRKKEITRADLEQLMEIITVFEDEEITLHHAVVISNLVMMCNPNYVPLRKLILVLKEKKQFLLQFMKLEGKFNKFLNRILELMDIQKEELNLALFFGFVMRLENFAYRSETVRKIARKVWELSPKDTDSYTTVSQISYALYLMENGLLQVKEAKEIFGRLNGKLQLKIFILIRQN